MYSFYLEDHNIFEICPQIHEDHKTILNVLIEYNCINLYSILLTPPPSPSPYSIETGMNKSVYVIEMASSHLQPLQYRDD